MACEILDGEAVLIHFETGCYYSAARTGAELIGCLSDACSSQALADSLAKRYPGNNEGILSDVQMFIEQLSAEGLIIESDENIGRPVFGATDLPYEAPALQRFDDLQDLLLLDPIHDVDAQAGWPHPAPVQNLERA